MTQRTLKVHKSCNKHYKPLMRCAVLELIRGQETWNFFLLCMFNYLILGDIF